MRPVVGRYEGKRVTIYNITLDSYHDAVYNNGDWRHVEMGPGATYPGGTPLGGIIMWSGSLATIPTGYTFCDGDTVNGYDTPDLRGMYIKSVTAADPSGPTTGTTVTTTASIRGSSTGNVVTALSASPVEPTHYSLAYIMRVY
jgi:hypothetical protein